MAVKTMATTTLPHEVSMASATPDVAAEREWTLANPWPWLGIGLAVSLWSWLWTLTFGANSSDLRVVVLAVGLLLTAVGVWLRWNDRQSSYLRSSLQAVRFGLGCLFGLVSLSLTGLFVYSFWLDSMQLRMPPLFLVWVTLAPLTFFAARRCFQLNVLGERNDASDETAFVFVLAAVACVVGSLTLYLGPIWALFKPIGLVASDDEAGQQLYTLVKDWDSIRILLRVLTVVCLGAAALTLASPCVRRLALSLVFVLHFCGICNAALAAPPAPWLIQQSWVRVFRPYLEFMYLNNAYHFYAPEPGPTSYLWFRLIYVDENDDSKEYGWWYKTPQVDDRGRLNHTAALEYQRMLSLTEAVAPKENPPPELILSNDGFQMVVNPIYQRRRDVQPMAAVPIGVELGPWKRIPYLRDVAEAAQLHIPNDPSMRLYRSFARFVSRKYEVHPEPQFAHLKFKSVKIYRVVHSIPTIFILMNGIPPIDPQLYHPFYVGNFDASGKQLQDNDPYLYWLLPSVRETPFDPDSAIRDYARYHAGDPNWYRPRGKTEWTEPPGVQRAN